MPAIARGTSPADGRGLVTIAVPKRTGHETVFRNEKASLPLTVAKLLVKVGNIGLDAVRAALFSKTDHRQPHSILLVRFGAIGDFVVALPALRLVRRHFSTARIVLLTAPSLNWRQSQSRTVAGGAILGDRLVDETIVVQRSALANWGRLREIQTRIRRLNPDLCIFLPFSGEPLLRRLVKMLAVRFLGARKNLYGYHTEASLGFFRRAQYDAGLYDHQLTATLRAIREVGVANEEVVFEIETPAEDIARVEEWWNQHGLNDHEPPIAICPSSKEKVKCWPLENFRDLGLRLLEDPQLRIVLVGGNEDIQHASFLLQAWGDRAISFAGKASILQTAEILRRCKLFVGVDSGPMHMAAALGRPVVGIFASVVFPVLWKPWGEQSLQIRHSVPCEFCFTTCGICPTGTMECIRGIRVVEVLEAVQRMLPSRPRSQTPLVLPARFPLPVPRGRS